MSINDSARDSVLAATLAALGESAPEPGTPRYGHLQIQIAVLLEDGKDDNPRFLSGQVRDALICAIAADRRQADDFVDIVMNGHHGLAYASDEHVIEAALDLTYEDILAAGLESPVHAAGSLSVNILESLSSPQAVDMVLRGPFDPANPGLGLLGSLNAELTRRGMANPFQSALADELGTTEVARG
ncbi:hypothetical protein [Variovorax sp. RA8]|uniref:hypothetical protein n=1 Tax=Variovorax sp. (strain JCM 16519 / RA8) TaxID=662548 RepID=UPI000AC09F78|nr:hypothetical protein [Variovorax sp. RA8]VTU44143.1 hypothetical protein RA8P2_00056 [Variovorax sp. RA8]